MTQSPLIFRWLSQRLYRTLVSQRFDVCNTSTTSVLPVVLFYPLMQMGCGSRIRGRAFLVMGEKKEAPTAEKYAPSTCINLNPRHVVNRESTDSLTQTATSPYRVLRFMDLRDRRSSSSYALCLVALSPVCHLFNVTAKQRGDVPNGMFVTVS